MREQKCLNISEEYLNRTYIRFLKQIKDTNWGCDEIERPSKPRGRKPKQFVRAESRPRTKGEELAAQAMKNKFFNFN